jgi:hypothetical protein
MSESVAGSGAIICHSPRGWTAFPSHFATDRPAEHTESDDRSVRASVTAPIERSNVSAPLSAPRSEVVVLQHNPLFAVASMLAPVLVFATPCVLDGRSFIDFPGSQVRNYAWMQKQTRSLHQGHLPRWDPNTLAGHSFAGEFQPGVFYPLSVLWAVVIGSSPGMASCALHGLVLLHLGLAGFGMFPRLRATSLSPPAASSVRASSPLSAERCRGGAGAPRYPPSSLVGGFPDKNS